MKQSRGTLTTPRPLHEGLEQLVVGRAHTSDGVPALLAAALGRKKRKINEKRL